KKLRVWNDAIELYIETSKILLQFPYELKKVASNSIDAAHSISRNIAEGYCRKSIKEYLKHLYIALGSSGELHTCLFNFLKANQISEAEFNKLDQIHYKTENELIQLVKSIQNKMNNNDWSDDFLNIS
ncbi:four helix bundle protein, partial [Bacteroidota bacterium]